MNPGGKTKKVGAKTLQGDSSLLAYNLAAVAQGEACSVSAARVATQCTVCGMV